MLTSRREGAIEPYTEVMIKRRSTGTVVVLLSIVGVLWIISGIGATPVRIGTSAAPMLFVRHSVADGVHTYAGIVDTSCPLGVSITATGSSAPHVVLSLSEGRGSACDSARGQRFSASVAAANPVLDSVTLDGAAIRVQVIEQ